MSTSARAFVLRHSRLQDVPGLPELRLHLSDDVFEVWHAVQEETGDSDAPIPFWAFAWGGGLAIASYLRDHPEVVAGRRVLDIASGSGLCAIAAMRAGAAEVTAVDIDPFSIAAIDLNAKANRQRIDARRDDCLVDEPPSDIDLILAGDCWYEEAFGLRVSAWLMQRARSPASTCSSATQAGATSRTTLSRSWRRTTFAPRPTSRTWPAPQRRSTGWSSRPGPHPASLHATRSRSSRVANATPRKRANSRYVASYALRSSSPRSQASTTWR